MFEWKKNIAQVVTIIVGSGLVVSGFNSFYNDFYNKPRIDIQIIPPTQNSHQSVVITNEGRIPATNFFLTLITPQDMVDYPNYPQTFSTLNETRVSLMNSTLLQMGAPMLPHGDGSLTRIDLRYNVSQSSSIYPQYIAYITYDQGSSKIFLGRPWTLVDVVFNFWNTYWIPIVTIAFGLYILLSIPYVLTLRAYSSLPINPISYFFIPFYRPFYRPKGSITSLLSRPIRRRRGYKKAEQILDDIILIQKWSSPGFFHFLGDFSYNWYRAKEETRRQIFRYDMKSYNLVESLFFAISERQFYLTGVPHPFEYSNHEKEKINSFNLEIRAKCDEIINNINWKDIATTK